MFGFRTFNQIIFSPREVWNGSSTAYSNLMQITELFFLYSVEFSSVSTF